MKQLTLLALLFLATGLSLAQDLVEEEGYIRYICTEDSLDYYEFLSYEAQEDVAITSYNSSSPVLYMTSNENEAYTVFFRHYGEENTIHADLYIGGKFVSIAEIVDEFPCTGRPVISIPMNECLGIDPITLGLPYEGIFTVDNQEYTYSGNLSFLVPLEDVWQWDLFVNEEYVLSFGQSEELPCKIIVDEEGE